MFGAGFDGDDMQTTERNRAGDAGDERPGDDVGNFALDRYRRQLSNSATLFCDGTAVGELVLVVLSDALVSPPGNVFVGG